LHFFNSPYCVVVFDTDDAVLKQLQKINKRLIAIEKFAKQTEENKKKKPEEETSFETDLKVAKAKAQACWPFVFFIFFWIILMIVGSLQSSPTRSWEIEHTLVDALQDTFTDSFVTYGEISSTEELWAFFNEVLIDKLFVEDIPVADDENGRPRLVENSTEPLQFYFAQYNQLWGGVFVANVKREVQVCTGDSPVENPRANISCFGLHSDHAFEVNTEIPYTIPSQTPPWNPDADYTFLRTVDGRDAAEDAINTLQSSNWINPSTARVFIHFTIYNPSVNRVTWVLMATDFTQGG